MKKLIACSVYFLLGGSMVAQDGSNPADKKTTPAPALQLVLELSDGSRVIGTPSIDRVKIATEYAALEIQLSRMRTMDFSGANHVARVKLQNGDLLKGQLAATEIALKTIVGPVVIPMAVVRRIRVSGADFVNSLGMRFVHVPGMDALFSIWDTRVQDYRIYAEATPGVDAKWKTPGFKQGEDHPVVCVSSGDAEAFCAWLTQKERKEGKIAQDQEYRLPTDKEWSAAVGTHKYAWGGDQWPPPRGAGNYGTSLKVDDYDNTSPVGSFEANEYGLYDMGGNVWQWCQDWFRGDMNEAEAISKLPGLGDDGGGKAYRDVRGASCYIDAQVYLLSSLRNNVEPTHRAGDYGFRCVLAVVPSSP